MKKVIFCFSIFFGALLSNFIFGTIPAEERAALIAFYNSTNGDRWMIHYGWKTPPLHTDGFAMPGTEGTWYGLDISGGHVVTLDMPNNYLIGSLPLELGNLSYLEFLDVGGNYNQINGLIPSVLGNLSNLRGLYLNDSQLSGTIPSQLGNLSNLQTLCLSTNQLSGSIPPELGNLSNLQHLYLSTNQLSGSIPPELGNLSNLEALNLSDNQLSGAIPYQLGNLSHLHDLYLDNNQLNGYIPFQLGNLTCLGYLYLNHNQLTGGIPLELGNLTKLGELAMNNNYLSGGIPPQLGNLTYLWHLSLEYNQLTGDIPPELCNLSNLQTLSLSGNQLSGSIPKEFSNLRKLQYFHMNNNQLSGSIPSEFGNLYHLEELLLNHNQLSGGIPSELGYLDELRKLYLNNNYLYGSIPLSFNCLYNIDEEGYLDIGYNCLSATDSMLRARLNSLDPDWEVSQCIEKEPPFGEFATPISGSTVRSSIATTGWALDDHGMDSVKIYREQENTLICIGDAIFIEGARPDVEIAYPGYPGNKKAGWGYMLLTNLLPNGGNGTFVIHAIATDKYGKTTTLGVKTIIADNVSAVKPFGAIDTPTQAGTASGKNFVNYGWALTPQPNMIPVDGSTINVIIDGAVKGHPVYNVYRSDIATLFPGYANTNGAVGYYYLDTTKLSNGVHTIAWTVTDDAGNSDGIGSRYFTIQNTGNDISRRGAPACAPAFDPDTPVFDEIKVELRELERLEINLSEVEVLAGYSLVGDQLRGLPIGSTLDRDRGVFYWQPGPGFVGEYRLLFIEKDDRGQYTRKSIVINIKPMH